jgi:Protein of unknown function (DUF1579)
VAPISELPAFVQRGLPGPFHAALKPLEGDWRVDKRIHIAIGTKENPAVSHNMICKRRWIGGGRHLEDITEGGLGDGTYYRLGVFGFSTMDHRYEFATFDGMNANSMLYRSAPLAAPVTKIVMTGSFTDQGLLAESYAGKSIPMRTTVDILAADKHTIDLHFMLPDQPEILVEHTIYIRA